MIVKRCIHHNIKESLKINLIYGMGRKKGCSSTEESNEAITADSNGNILIRVLAKPNAKSNKVIGTDEEGVKVQVNAPAVDGKANKELTKFMAEALGIKKQSILMTKGLTSKHKTFMVVKGSINMDDVIKKLSSGDE